MSLDSSQAGRKLAAWSPLRPTSWGNLGAKAFRDKDEKTKNGLFMARDKQRSKVALLFGKPPTRGMEPGVSLESSQAGRKPAASSPLRLRPWGNLGQALFETKLEIRSTVFPEIVTSQGSKVHLPKSSISHFNSRFIPMVAMDLPGLNARNEQDLWASTEDTAWRDPTRVEEARGLNLRSRSGIGLEFGSSGLKTG